MAENTVRQWSFLAGAAAPNWRAAVDPWVSNEYTDGRKNPRIYNQFDNSAGGRELVQWLLQQHPHERWSRKEGLAMKTVLMADPVRYPRMTTQELRDTFLIGGLFHAGSIQLAYVDLDRAVAGMAVPLDAPLTLPTSAELRAEFFTERRELGVLNIGAPGVVHVGASSYPLNNLDLLYIGRGNAEVLFESRSGGSPAAFYLLSYPAHATYPVTLVKKEEAQPAELGSVETCNRRTVYKYIHLAGAKSCQLVMGVTHLQSGSAWNTMPAHTHMRRSEIYLYFDVAEGARVFHFMGPPQETRHIIMANRDLVVSPGWSIHAGVGTQAYKFCWGMGGENQDYADMDPAPLESLR
ncbi:MAG TPA: 5-dehydro-4-deoxy-D-glucuronate isomerase [Terracidiphilus sp.]|nr:5-dehydro-4-deoxy-D-glucuronate isomerase [Terracidiphilus sp.]